VIALLKALGVFAAGFFAGCAWSGLLLGAMLGKGL